MDAYDSTLNILEKRFGSHPNTHRQRITKKQLQAILLLDIRPTAKGHVWDIKHKHLGVGVYEIWLEKRNG